MFFNKNLAFEYLTKNQKSSLLTYLKSFVKKYSNLSYEEIYEKFIENENYYLNVNNVHYEWIFEYFAKEEFEKETKQYIKHLLFYLEQKELQKPYIQKQKEYMKEQRKIIQEYKMSKLKPTKKQIYYYEKLCKSYNLEKENTEDLSRLDLKNLISKIIENNQKKPLCEK